MAEADNSIREILIAKRENYKEFISCQPFYFNGTKGVVRLIRSFERTELVFSRSNCAEENKVAFATGTLTNDALSWWNTYAQPIGIEQANRITWTELKRLLMNKYYPQTKIKKIEDEFYNLCVKGNDLKTYVRRFQELAVLCPNMVPNIEKIMEVFIGGLPRSIKGNFTASKPQTLEEAINIAHRTLHNQVSSLQQGSSSDQELQKQRTNYWNERTYLLRDKNAHQDPNVVTDTTYNIEMVDGNLISTNTVIQGCTLTLLNQPFEIDLTSIKLDSFDVVIGMDWLSKYHAKIICDEKVVYIPIVVKTLIIQAPVARAPYRLAPLEMQELSNQFQELADQGFIRPNYDCEIRYHPGKANVVADALSRKRIIKSLRVKPLHARTSNGHDIIWVIIDRLTKSVHFIPTGETESMDTLTWLYIKEIISRHGVPISIISDHDSHFTSRFWQSLQKALDMLQACAIDFGKGWEKHLPLVEFSYNNSYHANIKAASFEALYGRKCRSSVCWVEVGDTQLTGPEIIHEITERSCKFDNTCKLREIDKEVTPTIGPVAYKLELPEELNNVHNTFHVSNLTKCLSDESLIILIKELKPDDKLKFVEEPVEIIDREIKQLRQSRIPIIKVRWNSKRGPEYTWEHEDEIHDGLCTMGSDRECATLPKSQVVEGVTTMIPITTVEEKDQRRLEVKARSILMMGILNEHQLKFNSIKDVLERLGEKLSQEDVNQKLLRSLSHEWNTHAVVWRNEADLDTISMDDLYNNLKVYEPEVKGISSSSLSLQNMAFVSSSNNNSSSTNGTVNTDYGVSTASTQVNAAFLTNIDNLNDMEEMDLRWKMAMLTMRAIRFLERTGKKFTVNSNETISFDKSNVECYNCHKRGHFTRECRALRNQDNKHKESSRRSVPVETTNFTALVSFNGLGRYDWSDQADEGPNYALMAFSSLNSDSKVSNDYTCSNSCLETIKLLKSQNEQLLKDLKKSEKFYASNTYLSFTGLDEFANKPVAKNTKSSKKETKAFRKNNDALIIKEWVLDDEEENVSQPKIEKKTARPNIVKKEFVKPRQQEKTARKTVKKVDHDRQNTYRPRGNQRNWNNIMSQKLESNFKMFNKACYGYGSFDHLQVDYYEKIDGGYVDFEGNLKGGKITGKYAIKNVTDDHSRFTWVFFLATKDETGGILKSFITRIENLVDHKVKVIRCDNGTEFKNREMNQFCEIKGKFDGKADEGLFVGYSLNSKAFRVFNSRTKIVKENLHIRFNENTPKVVGSILDWLFDIDELTRTMNYEPIVAATQSNSFTDPKSSHDDGSKPLSDDENKVDEDLRKEYECNDQEKEDNINSSNNVNVVGTNKDNELPFDPNLSDLEDVSIFNFLNDDDDDDGIVADMNNLDNTIQVSTILTTRIHKDHPLDQVIRDLHSATQTRRLTQNLEEHGFAIGTKWVFRNKKDKKGIVIRNKVRLVAQRHTQEEGIDYDKFFALVARIEAIRLFLAYALFKDFMAYQMDVKSNFLYGKIKEEVNVYEPSGFEDPYFPDRVYKIKKALYGLHQAPKAWYETLLTYLLDNEFQRGKIDKNLFIKRHKGDILLVQVYVDDIIFGSTKKELCNAF
nr:retrovirus-related Pol polyprotein from transposon TNT 1-94 [Tanacetum cinerariifolium]